MDGGKAMSGDGKRAVEEIDVTYVANLARLELSKEERSRLGGQLHDIVGFVRQIGKLDLTGIEPTSHASSTVNVLRKDRIGKSLDREDVLANAPALAEGQFQVPKIVE
jgi:aspartyl-tRNA(Asn)/glutamyl-tRNA(Gln) amidotransferase subunit C